jgi:nucleotide-binding universal stress UspA family protein
LLADDPVRQMDTAQARYFETGNFEPPTAENPVSIVPPTETEPGIIAFHGSGADFDEFRLEMIGTGEGAQAYGYGLYFTDSEDIAKFYRDSLARGRSSIVYEGSAVKNARQTDGLTDRELILDNIATEIASFDQKPENVIAKKIKNLKQKIDDPVDISASAGDAEAQELADLIRRSAQRELEIYESLDPSKFTRGKMYKVGLAPKPDELLDYDAPLSQQPKKYKAALDEIAKIQGIPVVDQFGQSASFSSFQDALHRKVGPVNAMREFTDAGIPGIKYRAAGSRGAATADEAAKRNYVIFDDKAVKILEKYGIVGPVLVTGAGMAREEQPQPTRGIL